MATITSLPVAATIDATADTFPIVTNSLNTTQQINRNIFLNLASQPVGLSDSQTLTNKTLTSPTINGATLSGTLSGTYTIGGTPTFPSSVTQNTVVQTLTNKTLTSPTINSPTITNATISADTLTGYTTSNSGTIYGVSITSGAISGSSLTSSSVPLTKLTSDSSWAWTTWTPTFTNFTIGNGTLNCYYVTVGKNVYFTMQVVLGTTSSVGTNPYFTLPVNNNTTTYPTTGNTQNMIATGWGFAGGSNYFLYGAINNTTGANKCQLLASLVSPTYVQITGVSATVPNTWANTNQITLQGVYQSS